MKSVILAVFASLALLSCLATESHAAPMMVTSDILNLNETSNGYCDVCGGAKKVSIDHWCSKYSGWSQGCCRCIASHESGGNAHACNKNTGGSIDAGLWQINSMNWASCSGGHAPCKVDTNLRCAKEVFAWGGHTWKYWSTCGMCGCCGKR